MPILFVHAHPDDEVIFTGGTIARLATASVPVVIAMVTSGSTDATDTLGQIRRDEADAAAAILGATLDHLGWGDSGLFGESVHATAAARQPTEVIAEQIAALCRAHRIGTLVTYDDHGIYGHPDHLVVHRAGVLAAQLAGIDTVYLATVDREYLHFVETHVVGHAVNALLGIDVGSPNRAPLGMSTVEIGTVVDAGCVLHTKRRALAEHRSQIAADSEPLQMDDDSFASVYGLEWYVRLGPRGILDDLG